MSSTLQSRTGLLVSALLLVGLMVGGILHIRAADAEDTPKAKTPAGPQLFDTPEAAAKAMV